MAIILTDGEPGRRVSNACDLATQVLNSNWRTTHTVPAAGLYPHQWSWDSAFIAMGLRQVSPSRARLEFESLLAGQWDDGRIPQIVFDPQRGADYSPGPRFWRSEQLTGSPRSKSTAGLIQPPNHAWAAWKIFEVEPDREAGRRFLALCYPRLVRWHSYLSTRRTRGRGVLASIVHPWESGTDNSPLWDDCLARVPSVPKTKVDRPDLSHAGAGERPSEREYGKYYWLAERYRDHDCDDQDVSYPFLFEDPLFNSLWAVSELALANIARELGMNGSSHIERAHQITSALEELFDENLGCYVARDLVTGSLVSKATVNGLSPLLVPGLRRSAVLLDTLVGPRFLGGEAQLVPSYDATAPDMTPGLYWRGPAWFNMNWLIIVALLEHGQHDLVDKLSEAFFRLAVEGEFPEYVDPWTGEAHGTRAFSWTAALTVDLQYRRSGRVTAEY